MTKFYGVLFDRESAEEDYWPDEWQHWYCDQDVITSEVEAIVKASPCTMYHDFCDEFEDPYWFVLKASLHDDSDPRGAPELPPDADEILRRECLRAKVPWKQPTWGTHYGQLYECG